MSDKDTSVKVAVRIRPLNSNESAEDSSICVDVIPGEPRIIAGSDMYFTFDYAFGVESEQEDIYHDCVVDLVNSTFEGFNATILAYGQTGSGKTWTMGSSSDMGTTLTSQGIIPRVIRHIFHLVEEKEMQNANSSYKIQVQFLEIYGEDIKDLLDQTRTSKVTIREAPNGDVFVAGAREEVVSSTQQMMRTLEEGTKNRTTASTRMNLSSSRSHAIFTVMIEHTIHVGNILPTENNLDPQPESNESLDRPKPIATQMKQEVRRCKFHFVDLAGSERLKRTGAQGQQMKEGIDINKGLLALGNVISALGDETKRGKVHVPYRDSKLTRILQDSLGGNSKTLMICCVSPAYSNFFESVNALRYANRARNIKNKPVINRDPTLVIIDELKLINQLLASEIVAASKEVGYVPKDSRFNQQYLMNLAAAKEVSPLGSAGTNNSSNNNNAATIKRLGSKSAAMMDNPSQSTISPTSGSSASSALAGMTLSTGPRNRQLEMELKQKLNVSDDEIRRLTQVLRQAHLQNQELSDRLAMTQGERDFFRMKWIDAVPDANIDEYSSQSSPNSRRNSDVVSHSNSMNGADFNPAAPPLAVSPSYIKRELRKERDKTVDLIAKYVKEIEDLKRDLTRKNLSTSPTASSTSTSLPPSGKKKSTMMTPFLTSSSNNDEDFDEDIADVDMDWTSSIARAIAQAKEFIKVESKKLNHQLDHQQHPNASNTSSDTDMTSGNDDDDEDDDTEEAEAVERKFRRRQEDLKQEVNELSESIQVKENLVKQLEKSQNQYSAMKTFYEQKLEALSREMNRKQQERELLVKELGELELKKNESLASKAEKEAKLKDELKRRDEELKVLKKKQEELNRLSKVQTRYLEQLSKLETDIENMKRQRVDLTKTLGQEKKMYLTSLKDKAKEIDYLKRQLSKRSEEIQRLANERDKAQSRSKEVLREGNELRKRSQEFYRLTSSNKPPTGSSTGSNNTAAGSIDRKSVIKSAPLMIRRVLSTSELKTKKWLERQIIDINAREEAAETLRRQCEQQMSLIKEKEALEEQRETYLTQSISTIVQGSITNPKKNSVSSLINNTRDEEGLREIEDRIAAVDSQLKLRTRQISEIREQLSTNEHGKGGNSIAATGDMAIESLKKTAAQSLPAAHELIRLIFDMLVESRRIAISSQSSVEEVEQREEKLKDAMDRVEKEMQSLKHVHQVDLNRVAQEYEEKLQGLFDHSTIGQMVLQEGNNSRPLSIDVSDVKKFDEMMKQAVSPTHKIDPTAKKPSSSSSSDNESQLRGLVSISMQQIDSLRSQITKERYRSEDLESNLNSLESYRSQLLRMIDDRDSNIKFLEEERNFFKDMVYDLRANVEKLGGKTGKRIIRQIRSRAKTRKQYSHGGNEVVLGVSDDEEDALVPLANLSDGDMNDFDNEDSKSIMDQFEEIDSEIAKSKSVNMKGGDVIARLTDPSNFTGVHKKVFEEDISTKRKKVQEMKNHVSTPAFSPAGGIASLPSSSASSTRQSSSFINKKQPSTNDIGAISPDGSSNNLLSSSASSTASSSSPGKKLSSTSSARLVNRRASGEVPKNLSVRDNSPVAQVDSDETSSVISHEDVSLEDRNSMETMPDEVQHDTMM